MDEKKFEEGINCFAQLLGSFLELRKMGYTQEEINWAYNTTSGNFVPNFNVKNLSNLIESRKEN
jgi:dnaJ domain protein